ncbi:MAG: hypothetical protein R3195_09370 [Gemmatimonadota bacterium]|nr:hypothetical protein [Gemmatimonadota bacterium]
MTPRSVPRLPALAVLLAATSCGEDGPPSSGAGFAARDSAGIAIAENRGEPGGLVVLDGQPRLDLGVAEGDPAAQFTEIVGAAITSHGELVVADAGPSELRFFDADGAHVRTVGGQGEGPGEFVALARLATRGDSLIAWSQRGFRFSVFEEDGSYLGMTPPGAFYVGLMGDGTLISYDVVSREMPDPGTVSRSFGLLRRHIPGGETADTIIRFEMNDRYVHDVVPGFSERMFGRNTAIVYGDELITVADNDRWELRRARSDGTIAMVVRWDRPARPVTPADVSRYIETRREQYGDDPRAGMFMQTLVDQPPPDRMPAFGRSGLLRGDLPYAFESETGDLWILDYVAFPDEAETWRVFDADGRLYASVRLPPGVEVAWVGRGSLVAVGLDELDVPHVVVYDLPDFSDG